MTRRQINQISLVLLLVGFGSALVIALTAVPPDEDALLNDPRGNKKYMREMQMIGGKANVLAADFREWFAGLWQGPALGRTVAVLTVGVILGFRFVTLPPAGAPTPAPDEKKPADPAEKPEAKAE